MTFPGSTITNCSELSCDQNYMQLLTCSKLGWSAPNKSKPVSSICWGVPLSLTPSGLTSYRESTSTLVMYFQDSTQLWLMISKWNPSERSNLSLVQKMYPNLSPLMEIGPLHSTSPMMHTSSYSLIKPRNANGTNTIFYSNSQLSESPSTLESSLLTEPAISESQNVGIDSSPTLTNSMTFKLCTSTTVVNIPIYFPFFSFI